MSSAKKGKKTKGKSLSLGEFLGPTSGGGSSAVLVPPKSSWAEESADFDDDRFPSEKIVLPTAPRQARASAVDPDRVPKTAPFIAYVANLPFDVKDEDIEWFFKGLEIVTIRLPREGGEYGRFKGFGYVEFENRNDLVEALSNNDEMINNRKIRVDIAEEERPGGRREGGSRREEEREDRSGNVSDWRAAPRDSGSDRSPLRDRYDDRQSDRDRGYDRGSDRDRGYDRNRGYDRDRDRGFGDRERDRFGDRDRDRGYGDRDRNYGRDRDRYDDRGRFGGGRFDDRRGGGDRGGYRRDDRRDDRREDDRWRSRGGGGGGGGRDRDEDRENIAPKERPRLNLQPRTKTDEETVNAAEPAAVAANPSIFGAAKPVNTAQRELEIEKKLHVSKEPAKEAPRREAVTISAKDIFGNARPVDTAAREREIEQKLKKQDGPAKRIDDEEKDGHGESKRIPLKLEKRDRGSRPQSKKEDDEREERVPLKLERRERDSKPQNDRVEDYEREREDRDKDNDIAKDSGNEDEKEQNLNNLDDNRRKKSGGGQAKGKKGKKGKDDVLIINTENKFSKLGIDEEDA